MIRVIAPAWDDGASRAPRPRRGGVPACSARGLVRDPTRLAAPALANQRARPSPLGMEAGAPEALPRAYQFRRWPREEERESESPDFG